MRGECSSAAVECLSIKNHKVVAHNAKSRNDCEAMFVYHISDKVGVLYFPTDVCYELTLEAMFFSIMSMLCYLSITKNYKYTCL